MEKIKLNNIFNLSKEEINNCKIELNMSEGRNGQLYIDKWLSLSEKEKQSGINDCSYWPKYGSQSNFHVGQKVFSFVRKSYDEWLFISAATILDVPENRRSNIININEALFLNKNGQRLQLKYIHMYIT